MEACFLHVRNNYDSDETTSLSERVHEQFYKTLGSEYKGTLFCLVDSWGPIGVGNQKQHTDPNRVSSVATPIIQP